MPNALQVMHVALRQRALELMAALFKRDGMMLHRCEAEEVYQSTCRSCWVRLLAVMSGDSSRAHHGGRVLLLSDLAIAQTVRGELVLHGCSLGAQVGAGRQWGLRLGHWARLDLRQHTLWLLCITQ